MLIGASAARCGWPYSWNLDFDVAARPRPVHGSDYSFGDALNPEPARCGEHNDSELPRCEVLLIFEVRVGGHQDSESFFLSGVE